MKKIKIEIHLEILWMLKYVTWNGLLNDEYQLKYLNKPS